jgi:hypothetical protein
LGTPPKLADACIYYCIFLFGGRGGIRTLDRVTPIPPFQDGALDQLCDSSRLEYSNRKCPDNLIFVDSIKCTTIKVLMESQDKNLDGGEVHASFLAMDGIANRKAAGSDLISWVAPEFEQHHKTILWYATLVLGALLISAVIFLFTRDWMSPFFVFGLVLIAWYYARRKPDDKNFSLDVNGLEMGHNYFPLSTFKSFAVDSTTSMVPTIVLYPLRRFMPPLTLACPADKLQSILEMLGRSLPVEAHNPTRFDLLMSRIKF